VLYAPIIYPQVNTRKVYLPKVKWLDFWTGKIVEGWIDSSTDLPIYIREGSIVPLSEGDMIIYGNSELKYDNVTIRSEGNLITFSKPFRLGKVTIITDSNKVIVNGKEYEGTRQGNAIVVNINSEVSQMRLA
ncbi:MAG: glycoside hydrolase family 31 protein, partial [Sulfolobus sp.]